jgi:hypothetical protein
VLDDPAKAKLLDSSEEGIPLRKALTSSDDDYIGSCLAITLTKLAIKTKKNMK